MIYGTVSERIKGIMAFIDVAGVQVIGISGLVFDTSSDDVTKVQASTNFDSAFKKALQRSVFQL